MKHLLLLFFLLCSASAVRAQDVIVKKDGSTILSKVLEVGENEVKYKRFDNLNGPTYTINKSELQAINYQNGAKDKFSDPVREDNRYLPNNQNDGVQQYNDRALLALDKDINSYNKKAKTFQYIGIIGGIALIGTGAVIIAVDGKSSATGETDSDVVLPAVALMGAGVAGGVACLLVANHYKKQGNMLQSTSVWHHEIKFDKGSSLMTGIDVLKDNYTQQQTLGLGLRYNF